ncbi:hypothetical protein F2P81_002788 [Scophthalmus maximus]|uniref:EF-hand domain-containing protein n=1 Tax=Scophthalmus maximus TaxID=52904 RepID=A0A6A4TN53_SCOMX|nr:hypothetical protein F2P81_002788 [Scophthalmus maximus]
MDPLERRTRARRSSEVMRRADFAVKYYLEGSFKAFSLDTCRIMIAMLDRDFTGKMGFNEFKELFTALNGWKQNFMMFDQDRSGSIEHNEMTQAVNAMGYRISPQAVNAIIKRYNKGGRIFFDDYVACCVKLRALSDNFKRRDTMQQGSVTFPYDDVGGLLQRHDPPTS